MAKGKKTGGRTLGTPNKDKNPLRAIAESMGIDPWKKLLQWCDGNANALGVEEVTPELQFQATKEACKYLFAQKKAVETNLNIESDEGFRVIVEDYSKKDVN